MARTTALGRKIHAKRFAEEYIKNGGDATNAVLAIKTMKKNSALVRGKRLMERKEIRSEIEKAMNKHHIDFTYTMGIRKKVINKGILGIDNMRVSAGDVHNYLTGMEKVLLSLDNRNQPNDKSSNVYIGQANFTGNVEFVDGDKGELEDVMDGDIIK